MLEPLASEILRAVVSVIVPLPVVVKSLVAFGKLIDPVANAARFLLANKARPPANATSVNSLPAAPIVSPALKSGNALMLRTSAAVPRLIVSVPGGFEKSVVATDA